MPSSIPATLREALIRLANLVPVVLQMRSDLEAIRQHLSPEPLPVEQEEVIRSPLHLFEEADRDPGDELSPDSPVADSLEPSVVAPASSGDGSPADTVAATPSAGSTVCYEFNQHGPCKRHLVLSGMSKKQKRSH